MILAPVDIDSLFRVRVKGQVYNVPKTLIKKLLDVDSAKTTINNWLADKGYKVDFHFETKTIWIGPVGETPPDNWWVEVTGQMARLVDENFEGTGYEETWSEGIDTGCTLDEDSTIPGIPPVGAGSQCLKAVVLNATANDAFARRTLTNQNISYVRDYVYIAEEGFADTNTVFVNALLNSVNALASGTQIGQLSGVLKMRHSFFNNGAPQYTAWVNVSLNTWYRVEYQYDITNLLWEWKIDGATQANGTLTGATRIPTKLDVGIESNNGAAQTTVYHDLVVWDDATWPGVAGVAFQPWRYNNVFLLFKV